jgi:hypothetical protein
MWRGSGQARFQVKVLRETAVAILMKCKEDLMSLSFVYKEILTHEITFIGHPTERFSWGDIIFDSVRQYCLSATC